MLAEFLQAPEEVTRYFDGKGQQTTWSWDDVAPHEHAVSFTVAKSAGYDILDDVRAATSTAIAEFQDFDTFREGLEPLLRKKGWWGRQMVTGPDGTKQLTNLGSLSRLRTIYWANTSTARAAGEWERIQRTKRGIPFLIYELSSAEKRRPEHMGWVGIILPVDHPFWRTHFPPNGWLCKCRVRQITRAEAESLGYDPDAGGPQVVTRPWTNKRTGQRFDVPEGIDPGWQTNPGITRGNNARQFLSDATDQLSDAARRVASIDTISSRMFRAIAEDQMGYGGRGVATAANRELSRIALPIANIPEARAVAMSSRNRSALMSVGDGHKQHLRHGAGATSPQIAVEDYRHVQDLLERGEFLRHAKRAGDFIFRGEIEGRRWFMVLRLSDDLREPFIKSFRPGRAKDFAHPDYIDFE